MFNLYFAFVQQTLIRKMHEIQHTIQVIDNVILIKHSLVTSFPSNVTDYHADRSQFILQSLFVLILSVLHKCVSKCRTIIIVNHRLFEAE